MYFEIAIHIHGDGFEVIFSDILNEVLADMFEYTRRG